MLYLLQAHDDNRYLLYIEDVDGFQGYCNDGEWTFCPPPNDVHFTESDDYVEPGLYWWQKRYTDYADAKLIKKFKSDTDYIKWCHDHPELFI